MAEEAHKKPFVLGELVVYPSSGLGHIEALESRNGKDYLKVKFHSDDNLVLLPAANADELGLRHMATKEEIGTALPFLSDRSHAINPDWKQRIQENQALLKEGSLASICQVVCSLYRRSKIKELPFQEEKMYDSALQLLLDELSYVLEKSRGEAERLVFSHLEVL